jgi:predicted nucleic acid-binding protein
MKIIVNDASLLFDLIDIDLLGRFFQLPLEMNITDAVRDEFDEEYFERIESYLESGRLTLHCFDEEATEKIGQLKKGLSSSLSFPDCTCIFLAQTISATLLTGDKALRNAAGRYKIPVHGILWVLDQLIKNRLISRRTAHTKLQKLMGTNKRLPRAECQKRLKLWEEE